MADALSDVQKRFDKLVRDIISHINRIVNKLKKEKENTIRIYKAEVHEYYLSRREAVQNRGAEFDTLAKEREAQIPAEKKGEYDALVAQIQALREELEKLLEREMQIESGIALKIKDEPARIEKEIELMNSLLEYIKSHVQVGKLFSKGRLISPLNTEAIYQRITEVYNEVKSRETEEKAVKYYFEMKKEIEQKSEEILSKIKKLMAILGVEEKAVSPKAGKKKEKAVEKAKKVLKREENYFMLFSDVLKKLREVATSNLPAEGKLKEAQLLLKRLERYERREQWRASARKLDGKLKRILKISSISPDEKQEIEKDVRELKIFEGDLLVETVKKLRKKIRHGVQAEVVDWREIIGIIDKIQKDIQAVIAVEERLDKWLESEKKGIRGRVGARLGAVGRVAGGVAGFAGGAIGKARPFAGKMLGGAKGAAGGAVGGAARKVGSAVETAQIAAMLAGDKILEAAYSGVRGAATKVWGALSNWWSSLYSAAGNLVNAAKSKAGDLSGPINAVKSFGGNSLKTANTGVGFLIDNARKVLKMPHVDIKAKERIKGLADELGELQSTIGNAISQLNLRLPRDKIGELAGYIATASKRATEVAKALWKELSKVGGTVASGVGRGARGVRGLTKRRLRRK